jgi:Domain of unknown function (DUF4265)
VYTAPKGDRKYVVAGVAEPSGRHAFRVWFGDSFTPRDEISDQMETLGSLVEWSSRNLLAVDAANAERAQRVANFLTEREDAGQLLYETGRT